MGQATPLPSALTTIGHPYRFAHEAYCGMIAFVFVNRSGERWPSAVRCFPKRSAHVDKGEAAKMTRVFLVEGLPARLKQGPVTRL